MLCQLYLIGAGHEACINHPSRLKVGFKICEVVKVKPLFILIALLAAALANAKGLEVSFQTSDDVTIYGDLYQAGDTPKSAPMILLFHQGAGDARGEYMPLVSRLVSQGYNLLAIDQRTGGNRFGHENRTVAGIQDMEYSYCDAYPDLEAALEYAIDSGFTGKFAAWGSSYSAALVFRLASEHPNEIDTVLAFSPASGKAMAGCQPELYSDKVTQPLLALRPIGEMEPPHVGEQMKLFAEHGHQTYVADPGVHGSSMLNSARVEGSTEETWQLVLEFLDKSFDEQ